MQKIAKQKFSITGMTCTACSAHMEKAVRKLNGVQTADVSLMTNSMTAEYDEGILSPGDIIRAVIQSGYGASLPAFLLGHKNAVAFGLARLLLTFPIMYINDKYYKVGLKTLWNRSPNMDSLIAAIAWLATGHGATQALTAGVAVLVISCPCVFSKASSGLKLRGGAVFGARLPERNKNQGGNKTMNKTMIIEGMMCAHCTGRVEKALSAIDGVSAVEMSLEGKSATLTLAKDVDDRTLTNAVTEAGYEVVSVR